MMYLYWRALLAWTNAELTQPKYPSCDCSQLFAEMILPSDQNLIPCFPTNNLGFFQRRAQVVREFYPESLCQQELMSSEPLPRVEQYMYAGTLWSSTGLWGIDSKDTNKRIMQAYTNPHTEKSEGLSWIIDLLNSWIECNRTSLAISFSGPEPYARDNIKTLEVGRLFYRVTISVTLRRLTHTRRRNDVRCRQHNEILYLRQRPYSPHPQTHGNVSHPKQLTIHVKSHLNLH